MSANVTVLLVAAGIAAAGGSAALFTARGMRRELAALRREVAGLRLPGQRASAGEIRAAVAEALADERERELAEARAFWAEQEARETAGEGVFFRGGLYGATTGDSADTGPADYEVPPVLPFLPRQSDFAGLEHLDRRDRPEPEQDTASPVPGAIPHPSGPDFVPAPVVASQDQTADRLADLADGRIPLSDVRPGPLGTLDVYVFADGTTLCMTPGHRETARRLTDALDRGEVPVLRGGSAIAGAYALTFAFGDESVYVLADRVVASL
ncbi:hypothetical protein [Actinacidiphila acididurans]|uniref:Secreted protein n=1 Tax=Actinacidiphila acididurans TaxID=2784346 RepID=A0ABS2TNQ5_9ACTN|nr:hypothetical protein [Actinacidiphila acididurans]